MEHIAVWQIALLTLYSGLAIYDGNNTTLGLVKPSMAGFFAGLIMGDMTTGLIVGGTLNLLVLGVGNFGGASIPDYMSGAGYHFRDHQRPGRGVWRHHCGADWSLNGTAGYPRPLQQHLYPS